MLVVRSDESADTLQREGRGRDECVCSQRRMLIVVDGGPRRWTKIVDQKVGQKWWTQMVDPKAKCTKWLAGLDIRWVFLLLF